MQRHEPANIRQNTVFMTVHLAIEDILLRLGDALAIGLLIGLERGWKGIPQAASSLRSQLSSPRV